MLPMNWRITPSPPLRETEPLVGVRSPAMIRSRVVLPDAVRPDQGHRRALADPEGHVVQQHPAVGQVVADAGQIDVAHGALIASAGGDASDRVIAPPLGRAQRDQAASSMASAAVSALPCGSMPTLLTRWVTVPSTSASTQAARWSRPRCGRPGRNTQPEATS